MPLIQGYSGGTGFPQLPENVEEVYVTAGALSAILNWNNPTVDQNNSYAGVCIVRKEGSCPESVKDGKIVYRGKANEYEDTGLTEGVTYYYRFFAYNVDGEYQNSLRSVSVTAINTIPISDLAVGSAVAMNVNGVLTEFIVVNQGVPTEKNMPKPMYSTTCDGTWLLMKDIYTEMTFSDNGGDNRYSVSNAHTYLNNTFFPLLDSKAQSSVKEVKIPYHAAKGDVTQSVKTGDNGLSTKIFLLSASELGFGGGTYTFYNEGDPLAYFTGAVTTTYITNYNGTAYDWWLRTQNRQSAGQACYIRANGSLNRHNSVTTVKGIRPAMIVNYNTAVSAAPNANGAYEFK